MMGSTARVTVGLGDVELQDEGLGGIPLDELEQPLGVPCRDRRTLASMEHGPGQRPPEARRRPGDEPHSIGISCEILLFGIHTSRFWAAAAWKPTVL
jgi:hypothetical protein